MRVLVLNAGSSSQKIALYNTSPAAPPELLWEAQTDAHTDLARLLEAVPGPVEAVGHRVVHGGPDFRHSVLVTPEVKAAIAQYAPLAPAHNPAALEGMEAALQHFGESVPQVAVFDTAFHRTLPDAAAIYPGPYEWVERGIRRYGFHGINHQYVSVRAVQLLGSEHASRRIISCHLGNGASLAAIYDGKSVDTTMGFTPLEGLMMGTRSGSIDPSILLYLLRQDHLTPDALDQILNTQSGLKGISGISGDLRELTVALAQGNERARLALEIYVHRLRSGIGSLLASLGGIDVLIFTGGVGEHSALVRAETCKAFRFLGLSLDTLKNESVLPDQDIADAESTVRVLVITAQEDAAIARECWHLLQFSA